MSIECSVTNGTSISLTPLQLDSGVISVERTSWQWSGKTGGKQCLLDTTRPLHSWTSSGCGCPHEIKPVNILVWRGEGSWSHPILNCDTIDSWCFLREEESVVFKDVASGRLTTFQWMAHHPAEHKHHKLVCLKTIRSWSQGWGGKELIWSKYTVYMIFLVN